MHILTLILAVSYTDVRVSYLIENVLIAYLKRNIFCTYITHNMTLHWIQFRLHRILHFSRWYLFVNKKRMWFILNNIIFVVAVGCNNLCVLLYLWNAYIYFRIEIRLHQTHSVYNITRIYFPLIYSLENAPFKNFLSKKWMPNHIFWKKKSINKKKSTKTNKTWSEIRILVWNPLARWKTMEMSTYNATNRI